MLLRAATISPAIDRKAFSRDYPQKFRTQRSKTRLSPPVLPPQPLDKCVKVFAPGKSSLETRRLKLVCGRRSQSFTVLDKLYDNLSSRAAYLLRTEFTDAEIAHQFDPEPDAFGVRAKPRCERTVRTFVARLIAAKVAERCNVHDQLGIRLLTVESRCMVTADSPTFAQRRQARRDKQNAQSAARRAQRRERWRAAEAAISAACGKTLPKSDLQNASNSRFEPLCPRIAKASLVHRRKRDRLGRFAPPLSQAVLAEAEALAQPGCAAQPREADRFLKPQPLAQPDGPHPRQNEDPRPGPSPAVPQPPEPGVEALKICPLRGVGAFGGAEPASLSADGLPAASDLPCSPADMAPGMPPEMPEPEAPAATPDATEAFMQAAMRSVGYSLHHGFSAAERRSAEAWLARSPAHGERPDAWAKIWQRERHEGRAARPVTGMAAELAQHIKRAAAATPEDEPATPATEFFDPKAPWLQPLRATDAAGACQQILDIQRRLRDPALRGDEPGTRNARRAAAQRLRDLEMVCLGLKQRPMALTDFETFRQQHPWAHSLVVGTDGRDALRFNLGPDLWTHLAARIDLETSVEYRMDHPDTAPLRDPARVFFRRLQKWAYAQPAYRRLAYR